jgi:4,5-dihydroxyphthalate decarboxylase
MRLLLKAAPHGQAGSGKMTTRRKLTIAIADYPHTAALKSGAVKIDGVDAEFVSVVPQVAAYRRMVRSLEFDVCELAPTTYLIARAHGVAFTAIPVFVSRLFHHGGLLVQPDRRIRHPKQLEGEQVGVRAWSVTTGVWTRGIFAQEFGVDNSKIRWVIDDEEHVSALKLPANVTQVPPGKSLFGLMRNGTLAAAFAGNAGIGRSGDPSGGWCTEDTSAFPDMFEDPVALEAEWFARTGIYPMHATIAVKQSVLDADPWVARALFNAFAEAKARWLKQFSAGVDQNATDRRYRDFSRLVGPDPLPYGLAANRRSIEALLGYAAAQALIPSVIPAQEAFLDLDAT